MMVGGENLASVSLWPQKIYKVIHILNLTCTMTNVADICM